MTKTHEKVVSGITSRMRLLGLDFSKLAEMMYKDDNTIRRQLTSPNSNMTLNTIDEYINVIGGELAYISPESKEAALNPDINAMRITITELGAQIDRLKDKLEEKESFIEELQHQMNDKRDRIATLENALIHSMDSIDRKDRVLAVMLEDTQELMKKVLKEP